MVISDSFMNIKKLKSKSPLLLVVIFDRLLNLLHFFKGLRLSSQENKSPVLIVGCGRSGNTLLRSMLVAGKEVAIPPESYVWPRIIRKYSSLGYLGWNNISKLIISEFEAYNEFYTWNTSFTKLYKEAVNFPKERQNLADLIDFIYSSYAIEINKDNTNWGDKTPINTIYLDKILKVFPKAKIIHIVRDPRDVVSSYLKAGLYDNVKEPTEFWNLCIESVKKIKASKKYQLIEIKYESLVSHPENELRKVTSFLNISFKIDMLHFYKHFDNLGDTVHHSHHQNLKSPISTVSIGKWRTNLTSEQVVEIEKKSSGLIKSYNY